MNKVFLIGRLTNDTELATTASGINYCRFSLAVSRPHSKENDTDFFNIVAWRGLGENCGKFLKKGSKCFVVGALQNRSYTDKDNTKHYITEVIANEVEFLSPSNSAPQETPKRTGPITIEAGSETIQLGLEPIDPNEDLPF